MLEDVADLETGCAETGIPLLQALVLDHAVQSADRAHGDGEGRLRAGGHGRVQLLLRLGEGVQVLDAGQGVPIGGVLGAGKFLVPLDLGVHVGDADDNVVLLRAGDAHRPQLVVDRLAVHQLAIGEGVAAVQPDGPNQGVLVQPALGLGDVLRVKRRPEALLQVLKEVQAVLFQHRGFRAALGGKRHVGVGVQVHVVDLLEAAGEGPGNAGIGHQEPVGIFPAGFPAPLLGEGDDEVLELLRRQGL